MDGLELFNTGYARVCEEFTDASIAVTIMAHQSIGLKGILLNGSEQQVTSSDSGISEFCLIRSFE